MPTSKKARVVAIVGGGRVGRALGCLLRQRGWRIGAVVTRSAATARTAARAIGAGEPRILASQRRGKDEKTIRAILAADVILIATPDAAITAIASQLAQAKSKEMGSSGRWKEKVVLHTCGALDRSVLRPLERRGAATGSLHPLQTFGKDSVPKLEGVACAIEGSPAALRIAQRICRELGCIPIGVPSGAKPAYHAAAVFAAGHILGVIEAATRILMAAGFSRKQAVQALLPLTRQTLNNFERKGAHASWTGPAARGDLATIKKHLAALRQFSPEYRAAYAALTKLSVSLLGRNPRLSRRLVPITRG